MLLNYFISSSTLVEINYMFPEIITNFDNMSIHAKSECSKVRKSIFFNSQIERLPPVCPSGLGPLRMAKFKVLLNLNFISEVVLVMKNRSNSNFIVSGSVYKAKKFPPSGI